ncbi:hypothetical protein NF27_BA00090 [Candidatus Jidaibacter acanthamoeba]|uniref:Uncharacterized protein n=1 Tax=Candidatus Jidaibacter acanthamoebae TaxID=86105 RepID=A0A0C1N1F0_9RICK|nr:hypothetical protein [Candidatus Jidaibacter acanthamoeba]KIE06226.1 hypothetical protein NF27_BA00090 [Candidatus Jidaibacter acanthamoeba]
MNNVIHNRKTELKLLINSNIIELTWGKDKSDNINCVIHIPSYHWNVRLTLD